MDIFYIAFLTFFASVVGTMTGFGTSTILIPVLAIFFPPLQAIFFVSVIHWFGNVWKIALFQSGVNWKLIAFFGISGLLASFIGASVSLSVEPGLLLRALGVFLAAYSLFFFFGAGIKIKAGTKTALAGGALSGFFSGVFGIGGAVRSAFLLAYDLPKVAYIATAGAIGLLVDSTRIATYFFGGAVLAEKLWWGLLVFVPVSFFGAYAAKRIVEHIPQNKFKIAVACGLFLLALKLLIAPE